MTLTIPTEEDIRQADLLSRQLSQYPEHATVHLLLEGQTESDLQMPLSVFHLFKQMLTEVSKGNAITLLPVASEMTTQQAADLLNVSRPYLIELLNQGVLPYKKVGTHRRLLAVDVIMYQRRMQKERRETLDRLIELDQELGLE
jgi:excisionase family DNA binding protein